ncbi:MAG: hypothetical protein A4E23_00017 [Methanomethylovorans sp. PtaU1.Bin073]|nr:MAG: hypothetical protein A4E23_00017 [Methanomethylovorans sp. PtaU1.Bin073]
MSTNESDLDATEIEFLALEHYWPDLNWVDREIILYAITQPLDLESDDPEVKSLLDKLEDATCANMMATTSTINSFLECRERKLFNDKPVPDTHTCLQIIRTMDVEAVNLLASYMLAPADRNVLQNMLINGSIVQYFAIRNYIARM